MNLIGSIKNRTYYYFDDMIKFVDFYFDNVLIDENQFYSAHFIRIIRTFKCIKKP